MFCPRICEEPRYGVRLNMEADAFNSVLVDRGDRVSIQGDGHPTMATALAAFSSYELVKAMLNQTDSGSVHGHKVVDQGIMPYPMYRPGFSFLCFKGARDHVRCLVLSGPSNDSLTPRPVTQHRYWTMSVNDWYWASGDTHGFLALVPDMRSIVDARVADFLQKPHMTWMGWDDRVGNCDAEYRGDASMIRIIVFPKIHVLLAKYMYYR